MLKGKIGRKMISCGLYDYTLRVTGADIISKLVGVIFPSSKKTLKIKSKIGLCEPLAV
jgi:hypothetical protein